MAPLADLVSVLPVRVTTSGNVGSGWTDSSVRPIPFRHKGVPVRELHPAHCSSNLFGGGTVALHTPATSISRFKT